MDEETKRDIWVVFTDLTEGRGRQIPIEVCTNKFTALRLARNRGVQGTDAEVRPLTAIKVDGTWYAPISAVKYREPTVDDLEAEELDIARQAAIEKAKLAGLTDADIAVLSGKEQP